MRKHQNTWKKNQLRTSNRECPSNKLIISMQEETAIGEYQQIQEEIFALFAQTQSTKRYDSPEERERKRERKRNQCCNLQWQN